ncbi:uncharacterized protein LOC111864004 [Cryptotermes secundus]|nr:uncharacterized protein LOC111864004 [Cryptotermes secundus]
MLPSLVVVSLVVACGCSDLVWSLPELSDTNTTDNRITAHSGRDAKHRVTRSDVRAALGNKLDPGFWPARGRRSDAPPFWANRGRSLRQKSQGLRPYWRPGTLREDRGRLRLELPLYAEQPRYILLDRRDDPDDSTDSSEPFTNPQDPFWVARGRRDREPLYASEKEDSLWASMQGLHGLLSSEEPFREGKIPRAETDLRELIEEPFWSARVRRSSFKFLDDLRSRYGLLNGPYWSPRGRRSTNEDLRNTRGFLESLSAEEPFWAARGKKSILQDAGGSGLQELTSAVKSSWSGTPKRSAADETDDTYELTESMSADEPVWAAQDSRSKRSLLESISVEQPYWAARGRRTDEESEEKRGTRVSFRESLSAEEPFWAARGRRGFLESLSAEEPFWAARGKKESPRMTSPSPEDFLSQIRTREMSSKSDPWWPVRGKRVADTDTNPEDERFWRALESKTRNNTLNRSRTS